VIDHDLLSPAASAFQRSQRDLLTICPDKISHSVHWRTLFRPLDFAVKIGWQRFYGYCLDYEELITSSPTG